jgi:hypothetical protein
MMACVTAKRVGPRGARTQLPAGLLGSLRGLLRCAYRRLRRVLAQESQRGHSVLLYARLAPTIVSFLETR